MSQHCVVDSEEHLFVKVCFIYSNNLFVNYFQLLVGISSISEAMWGLFIETSLKFIFY